MLIRKKFSVESAHIVRNCTSHRCSHSVHGHSAEIEVLFEGTIPDNAGMLVDFGIMKGSVKSFIDSMDHCYLLWSKDNEEFKSFIKANCDRWIELPFNPSAENLAVWIHSQVQHIIDSTAFRNGEGKVSVNGVRYHETKSGWAQSSKEDIGKWIPEELLDAAVYSVGVQRDWDDDLNQIFSGGVAINPLIPQQVK